MSKTKLLTHIVFATKYRAMTITETEKRSLYGYILGICNGKDCKLIRINGIANDIHMLIDIHPTVAVATLVRDIKHWSSKWLITNPKFPHFQSWGDGYYAVSVSPGDSDNCKQYIINQEAHHLGTEMITEMETMALHNHLVWYPDDWK